jgi:hypothetical protein
MSTKIKDRKDLGERLQLALAIECALMAQYLYAAYTTIPATGADAAEEAIVNRWSMHLSDLAIGEMFHIAAVANLIVAAGSQPEFENADFSDMLRTNRGKWVENGGAFQLSPFSPETLKRLLQYELESAPQPKREIAELQPGNLFAYVKDGLWSRFFDPWPSIGMLYREIHSYIGTHSNELVTKRALLLTEEDVDDPATLETKVREFPSRTRGILRLTASEGKPNEWNDVVWTLIFQGEGGQGNPGATQSAFSHLEILALLISEAATNRTIANALAKRNIVTNPTNDQASTALEKFKISNPAAVSLALACSWTFVLVLQFLSAIWRDWGIEKAPTKKELFKLVRAVMMALFGPLAATLVRLPAGTIENVTSFAGPTFEFPRGAKVDLPGVWSDAIAMLAATLDQICEALNVTSKLLADGPEKTRVINGIDTVRVLQTRIETLRKPIT